MLTFTDSLYIFNSLENTFRNPYLLISICLVTLALKIKLLYYLIKSRPTTKKIQLSWLFLIIVLAQLMIEDLAWILRTVHYDLVPSSDYRIVKALIRFAWSTLAIRYHALGFLLEHSVKEHYKIPWHQKILIPITCACSIFFIARMIIDFDCAWHKTVIWQEIVAFNLIPLYTSMILAPASIFYTSAHLRDKKLPRIISHQLKMLIFALNIPNLIISFLHIFPFSNKSMITAATNSYILANVSNIFLTYMIYFCVYKIVNLRFLNIKNHVQSTRNFNFIDNFKDVLEQLGKATTIQELTFITQEIFNKAFLIPLRSTTLHSCTYQPHKDKSVIATTVDTIFSSTDNQLSHAIQNSKILIYDEIAFNNFYEQDDESGAKLAFLDSIGADICIPIYNQQKIVGCIIVERNARPTKLYGNIERDEMIIFTQYLGNIINLMQSRNLENIIASEKAMKEELFSKHQEINQYKESMRSFLYNKKQSRVGIIFYKNRQFVFGNRDAQELVSINLNMQVGHPLTKACKQIVTDVTHFQATQTLLADDGNGSKIVINGMPYLDRTHVILVIYHPEATDLIYKQIEQLKNPSEWDYLLYLETTKTGQLINQMIPGNGTRLLNFKIEILKTALSSKASLLDMPSEDLVPTVELLHHISLRSQLHTITLTKNQTSPDLTIELFGLNPLFGLQNDPPLLKKLDNMGTLFIQNVHFLNKETQDYLAEYIHYGFFRIYKSDQKILSNTRIICSSNQDLDKLVMDGSLSPLLMEELQKTKLVMPALNTMDEDEIDELAHAFFQQALADKTFEKILEFDKRDRKRIIDSRPSSLWELKKRIQSFLTQKSRTNNLNVEKTFDPGYQIADPDLMEIARLGKHALKDEKAMTLLWNKFKNQNKIAAFLGVNRSSVNRRCKDYKLNP